MKKRLLSLALCLALCLGLLPVGVLATDGESGGIYVPSGPTERGGGTYIPGEDTRTEIWRDTSRYQSISRNYDGTTDGSTIPIDLTFTDGTNNIILKEGTGFTAKKTFDSADAGWHTVTVEIALIGEAAAKYKLKAGEETFTIGGNINKAYPDLTVSLSKTACTAGEKLLPLLSVEGAPEDAAVTYYYTQHKTIAGDSEFEGSDAVPAIDENTAISDPGTYYVYAKSGETKNYEEERSATVELTVNEPVVEAASITKADGTDGGTYESLPAALNAAQNGDTVTLLSDVDLGETYVTISKSITFDLNGKTLSSSEAWLSYGVLMVKNATVTVKNGTVKAAGDASCAIRAYGSGAIMTLEDVTATVTSGKSSVTVGDFGSTVIKSGDYQGLYVGKNSHVTLEGGTFRPYMDTITNENVKSIFWKVNETTDATSCDCMELLGDGCVYVDENRTQVRTGGGFNTVVTVQQGTAIDAPVAKIGDVKYASLSKAINAVQNGGTITLLNDLDLGNGAVLQVGSSKKNFTIDLDNHTLRADGACLIMLHNGSQLTLKNGTLDGSRCTSYDGVLFISSNSELTLENVTAKSGTVADTLNGQRSVLLAYVTYGTVEFNGGTYTGGVLLKKDGNAVGSAVLKSGTFQKGTNDYSIKTEDSGKHLSDYLDESLFWNGDTVLDLSSETQTADEVTVRPCKHNWENGKCTVCQKVCDHGSADGKSMTEDPCPTCGMRAAAQVDITGSATKYFPSFTDALSYATQNSGCTLKLLADVVDVTVNTDKSFIFDLNGCEVYSLNVNSRITLKDSSGGNGKITEWLTVPSGMTIGELLEEGYAFKKSDGTWPSGTEQAVGNVSVLPVPIISVSLDALNVNDNTTASTTMQYGMTGGVKLSASCNIRDLTIPVCKWYKIGGTQTELSATGMNYFLPDDLPAGRHTYCVTFTSDGYSKSAEITITVEKANLSKAEITFPDGNEAAFNYVTATGVPKFIVTYNGQTLEKDKDFTITKGSSTYAVGPCTLTIQATDSGDYTGSKSAQWKVRPLKVAASVGDIIKTYDGTTDLPANAKITLKSADSYYTGATLRLAKGTDYEVLNAHYDSADASTEEKTISFTIKLKNAGYVFEDGTKEKTFTLKGLETDKTFTITKAPALDTQTGTLTVANNHKGTYTFDLKALLPTLEAPKSYGSISYGTPTINLGNYYTEGAKIEDGVLSVPINAVNSTEEKGIGTITVVVTTENYNDITLTLNVSAANKKVPTGTPTLSKATLTYGYKLSDITLSGSMKDGDNEVAGTFTWENPNEILTAGKHQAGWVFTPTNRADYIEVTGESEVTVAKATPSGTPSYTAITESAKTLEDAHLAVGTLQPEGFIQWVDADGNKINVSTEVKVNTAYTWKFTPYDENYTDLTGTITLWHKSSSGSSSGSVTPGTKTDTVKNPDGSTTKTETKADGSKTETTTASSSGGSTGITVTKTDAKGNTTTEASAKLSDQDVKEAQKKGEAVIVPVKEIQAAKDANAATKIKIDVPNNANKTTVEIPVENVTSGTVAVIVHEDGTEELVKNSKPTEHGVQLELSGSTTVKIIDNSKTFDDTKGHWSQDDVNFVAARELFNGVGGNQFGVSQPMTRGMVNTVLARLADVDTTPGQGQAWYEVGTDWAKKNGISDGTNPTAPVTREQLATLLYRYAGSPSVSGTLHAADAASVSDYAEDALLWANQNGIVNGVGSNTIAPKDNAQRAQVAAMLARYLQNQ